MSCLQRDVFEPPNQCAILGMIAAGSRKISVIFGRSDVEREYLVLERTGKVYAMKDDFL